MPSKSIGFQDMTVVASEGMFGGSATFTVKKGNEIKTFTQDEFAELIYPSVEALFSQPSAPPSC